MAYDTEIEDRVDSLYTDASALVSKKMFGGVCYMYEGNMAFGILQNCIIVRLGDAMQAQGYIDSGKAEPFDISGKTMKSWILVDTADLVSDDEYIYWLEKGLDVARSLPPK